MLNTRVHNEEPQTKSDMRLRRHRLRALHQQGALLVKTQLKQEVGIKSLERLTVKPAGLVQQTVNTK